MLPEQNSININYVQASSYTYNINRNTNRISSYIDGKEAIVQACYLILQTERYESLIYIKTGPFKLKTVFDDASVLIITKERFDIIE